MSNDTLKPCPFCGSKAAMANGLVRCSNHVDCGMYHTWVGLATWNRRAANTATAPSQPDGYVRYCPHCGSIGDVEKKYRDCCPDGSSARYVPNEIAEQAKLGFKQLLATAIAAAPVEQAQIAKE